VRDHALDWPKVTALGYNDAVDKHLHDWSGIYVHAPMYFVTSCTKIAGNFLLSTRSPKFLLMNGARLMIGMDGLLAATSLMPDHVHFFCRPELGAKPLSEFVGFWKSYTSRRIRALGSAAVNARGYKRYGNANSSDHVLRSSESYSEK